MGVSSAPYSQQGDDEFEDPHMRVQRKRNQSHPSVVAALANFWECVVFDRDRELPAWDMSVQELSVQAVAHLESIVITREYYLDIYSRIATVLLQTDGSRETNSDVKMMQQMAEEAWSQDTGGNTLTFSREQWFQSLFE